MDDSDMGFDAVRELLWLSPFDWEAAWKMAVAAVLGGTLGFERELTRHPAGLRTHMLVALGSAAFLLTAFYLDATHTEFATFATSSVIQGIITGMGFIGAGSIMKDGFSVHGLTTAASLWVASAVGVMTASGMVASAVVVTILALIVLLLSRPPHLRPPSKEPGFSPSP